MVDIPLTWQLQIQGAENVKSKLSDLNGQFERGEITTEQYATGLRSVNRDARVLSNSMNIQKNIFLATHPVLNNLTRVMSIFGSVMHAVTSALNTINLATIALNTNSSQLAQDRADVAQKERELQELLKKHPDWTNKIIEAEDALAIAQAKLAEDTKNQANQMNNAYLSIVFGIGQVVTAIAVAAPKIIGYLKTITAATWVAAGPWVALGALVAYFSLLLLDLLGIEPFATWSKNLNEIFKQAFGVDLRQTIIDFGTWWDALWINFAITSGTMILNIVNSIGKFIVDGINSIVRSVVNAINSLISIYNAAALRLHAPTIQKIPFTPIGFSPIGLAPTGSKNPTTTPGGISPQTNPGLFPRTSGGGGGNTINITVQGSILTENDIKKVFDKWLKNDLQTVGFG